MSDRRAGPAGGAVAGVLLAAGSGSRLGRPKALLEVGGRLLVERGAELLREAGCAPVVVVLGAGADEVAARADLAGAEVVRNDAWASGMGSSLRAGLEAVGQRAAAAVVALADQPLVTPAAVHRLVAAWRAGAVAAVASYGGAPRNPVLLDAGLWPDALAAASGDRGARGLLRARPDLAVAVPCDDVADPLDVDTPADLAEVRVRLEARP